MNWTNLDLVKIKEYLMNGYQQWRKEKKDVYTDELLLRFLSSSHHIFLIAIDGEWINHARNKNTYLPRMELKWCVCVCVYNIEIRTKMTILCRLDHLLSWSDGQIDESIYDGGRLFLYSLSFVINLHLSLDQCRAHKSI